MPRRAQPCPTCGQMFFPASLPIHARQCAERLRYTPYPCEYCSQEVRLDDMAQHLKRCSAAKMARAIASRRGQRGGDVVIHGRSAAPAAAGSVYNAGTRAGGDNVQYAQPEPSPPRFVGGLAPCNVCGRKFAPDRLGVHQRICRSNASRPEPRPPGEQARGRRGERRPGPAASLGGWRQQREDFLRAMRSAKAAGRAEHGASAGLLPDLPGRAQAAAHGARGGAGPRPRPPRSSGRRAAREPDYENAFGGGGPRFAAEDPWTSGGGPIMPTNETSADNPLAMALSGRYR